MKILLIVDDYIPDSTKIAAKMMHELALQFIEEGNQVTVLTPCTVKKDDSDLNAINNLTIYRFLSGNIKNVSKFKRAINETLLSIRAYLSYFSILKKDKHDLILYYSPTIFFGPIVSKLKKTWDCPSYLILRDFFPQWAIDQNILKEKSLITKYFRFFEKINYKAADIIGLQSPNNLDLFSKNVKTDKNLSVIYNWTNDFKNQPQTLNNVTYRSKLKLEDKTVFFYGGNMGKAQDMLNLMRLAKSISSNSKAHFVFVGMGDEVELVKKYILKHSLKNVNYLEPVNQKQYDQMLIEFDVGLFSLHRDHSSHNFPGKLLGYMANKMPILGSINLGNDLKPLVEEANAGLISINGNDIELKKNALKLLNDIDFRSKLGDNAQNLLINGFSAKNATMQILNDVSNYLIEK